MSRTREVYKNDVVCNLFVVGTQRHARNARHNLYFQDDVLYSYGSHFPLAQRRVNAEGRTLILITCRGYSRTTDKHRGEIAYAAAYRHQGVIVPKINPHTQHDHNANLNYLCDEIKKAKAKQLRAVKEYSQRGWANRVNENRLSLNRYCGFWNIDLPAGYTMSEVEAMPLAACQ